MSSNQIRPSQQLSVIAGEDVFVIGLRRSGIHAAIHWLIPHANGLVRFLNNPEFDASEKSVAALFSETAQLYHADSSGVRALLTPSILKTWDDHARQHTLREAPDLFPRWARPLVRSAVRKVHRWRGRVVPQLALPFMPLDDFQPVACNLFALENLTPRAFSDTFPAWSRDAYAPCLHAHARCPATKRVLVLLIREPWNQLASLLKAPQLSQPRPVAAGEFLSYWLDFAREFCGMTRYLEPFGQLVRFNYDRWFNDATYRHQLSDTLGRPFTDAGLEVVSGFGGGSSFDHQTHNGRGQHMAVHQRWRAFADHPLMRALCRHEELIHLSHEIFACPPPIAS